MQVVKRDGRIVDFDKQKILAAIEKANAEVKPRERASARKNEKNTLWGYRKFCHCISLYISIMRWRNKNIAVRK